MARKRQSATPAPGPGAPPLDASVAALRALAHPLRVRLVELFAEAPRTTKQVADLLGQPPTRLYHHVAALERAGLLKLKETRPNRGTIEKWYVSAPGPLVVRRSSSLGTKRRGAGAALKKSVAAAVLEQSRRELMAAAGKSEPPPLLSRLVLVGQTKLAVEMRKRLFDFVESLHREYGSDDAAKVEEGDERWACTIAFAPVWP